MLASSTTSPQTSTNYSCSPAAPPRCVSPPVTFGSRCLVSLSQYPPLPSWYLRVQVSGIAKPEPPHLSPSLWCGLPLVYSLFVVICGWASLSYSVVWCGWVSLSYSVVWRGWMSLPEHTATTYRDRCSGLAADMRRRLQGQGVQRDRCSELAANMRRRLQVQGVQR